MLLAGDIGGTKTILALYMPARGVRTPLVEATFQSGDYVSLEFLVQDFIKRSDDTIQAASFGVAGPVVSGKATITNLPWVIEEKQLRSTLKVSTVYLLNDLEAIATAVPTLEHSDVQTLNEGQAEDGGAIAVIAPGTGLGEAFLTWTGSRYQAHATEGGHADFAPNNAREVGLLRYLQHKFGHVSLERVCSGSGIPNIYDYLKESSDTEEPPWLSKELAGLDDPTPVIINTALDAEKTCDLCTATLETFVSIMGAEAGNLALKVLATGGVYLGGGIPPRIIETLQGETFMEAFTNKGRMSHLLRRMPVHIILNPKTALMGAAIYGLRYHE